MMWSGGVEPDTIFQYPAQRDAILAAAATALPAIHATVRGYGGNPSSSCGCNRICARTTGFRRAKARRCNTKAVRDALVNVARADPAIYVGTWVPGAAFAYDYWNEMPQIGWVHPVPSAYHAAAEEMGRMMALDGDLADAPPAWATMAPPSAPTVQWQPSEDVSVRWNPPQSGTGWFRVRNLHLGTGAVIDQLDTPSSQYLFTRAKQVATYGYDSGRVARYLRVRSGQRRRRTGAEHHAVQVLVGRLHPQAGGLPFRKPASSLRACMPRARSAVTASLDSTQ